MDYKQITSMTPEGLSYLDEHGKVMFIGFQECAQNYRNYVLTSGEFEIRDRELYQQETPTCVGWSDKTAKQMYIELFSEPRLRIEFRRNWLTWDMGTKFGTLQDKIRAFGWKTLDIS